MATSTCHTTDPIRKQCVRWDFLVGELALWSLPRFCPDTESAQSLAENNQEGMQYIDSCLAHATKCLISVHCPIQTSLTSCPRPHAMKHILHRHVASAVNFNLSLLKESGSAPRKRFLIVHFENQMIDHLTVRISVYRGDGEGGLERQTIYCHCALHKPDELLM
eukprot:5455006-Amphidinium_carterae.1